MKLNIIILFVCVVFTSCVNNSKENMPESEKSTDAFTTINCDSLNFKVLQFNIWLEGTKVEKGFEAIVDNIIQSKAEFVTMSEIANYSNVDFIGKLINRLKSKGEFYYGEYSKNTGIISKFPISKQETVFYDDSNSTSVVLKSTVKINKEQIVIYSAHLDYTHYSCYLPRGYSGVSWKKLKEPVLNIDQILKDNLASQRDEAIKAFINDAKIEQSNGSIVILGGDFNEPSHLDWASNTKDLFDHNGLEIPWNTSVALSENGYVDAYRKLYANAVTHPGFTFPSDNKDKNTNELTWAPDVDERERIDFIYYSPQNSLHLKNIVLFGPNTSIVNNRRQEENASDVFIVPNNVWPTDHKAVLASFNWCVR